MRAVTGIAGRALLVMGALLLATGCGVGTVGESEPPTSGPTPDEDAFASAMVACLAERGWTATIRPDGGFEVEYPTTQDEQFRADRAACSAAGGYDQPPPAFTQESATQLVADMHAAAECLREHDYDVPAPPPDAQMVDGLMSPDRDPGWDIYGGVPEGSALSEAQGLCRY